MKEQSNMFAPSNIVLLLCAMQKSLLAWCHMQCANDITRETATHILLECKLFVIVVCVCVCVCIGWKFSFSRPEECPPRQGDWLLVVVVFLAAVVAVAIIVVVAVVVVAAVVVV